MLTSDENALLNAARDGKLAQVQSYLNQGVNVNCMDNNGYTPLHTAASSGHVDVVRLLLEKGANVNACGPNGYTPLHTAASSGHVNVVRLLLEKGAKLDTENKDGQTPLEVAEARSFDDPVAKLFRDYVHMQGENQLFDALREKRVDDAMRLLQNDYIRANLRDNSETPLLHLVVSTQDLSLLQKMLSKPDLEIDAKDATGRTALAVAITADNAEAAQALYQAGASILLVDITPCASRLCSSTPVLIAALRQAASANDDKTVAQLLRLGVSCSLGDEKGATAWHAAAAAGHLSVLTMLLQGTKEESGINATNHVHSTSFRVC
ncbi:hypothetical protein SDRG_11776 [Saprolegnia diclina VS20]|uniref:Uncharacterized protein n=1 Tax=Saprolegnia diclina (strain VS20) TaxID=1156394 RepID=T0Q7A2_SAPDV|nr:hypothetical protein SDRG_11776 [Saprolegnia diclina VS20]EQC30456.1 hypothetical protein SDRG_11776 [Saprolegnia diclina VS20]|eukprot:XP_008616049.1 hypothetical protein SDRG_11776 [Saprolegnia diclina VS20]